MRSRIRSVREEKDNWGESRSNVPRSCVLYVCIMYVGKIIRLLMDMEKERSRSVIYDRNASRKG